MAKFSSKQILHLIQSELERRLKSDESALSSTEDPHLCLSLEVRISLLRDLITSLDFYLNYEFE